MHDLGVVPFYYPRRLGRPPSRSEPPTEKSHTHETYEAWREGMERHDRVLESIPEDAVRGSLLQDRTSSTRAFTLVTGEPGSGKSRFLEELLSAWGQAGPVAHLGKTVPILVRLRDVGTGDLSPRDPEALADQLWRRRAADPLARTSLSFFYDREEGRLWWPLWLLDGLDELPADQQTADLFRRFAILPGLACVSCRTAIAQANARELFGCVGEHFELLPLNQQEQLHFLSEYFEGDEKRAGVLHQRVRAKAQLRELAGSPLLLSLIAEVGETVLPAGRAAFYQEAVVTLWERRVKAVDREPLRPYRDRVLTALAAHMTLKRIIAPMQTLDEAFVAADVESLARPGLVEALKASGLLRVVREKVEFLHLTLQEFYLAKHLASVPIADVLKDHWRKPSYEETLALLIALRIDEDKADEADQALSAFADHSLAGHRHEPTLLWEMGRSPLRLVFHLLARAGVKVETLPQTWNRLQALMRDAPLLRLALGSDRRTPAQILECLALDDDEGVRLEVAQNSATPAETLDRLGRDEDARVRLAVAQNTMTPAAVLECLAGREPRLRLEVARNLAAPADVLRRLAYDVDHPGLRSEVARNLAAPQEVLVRLSTDGDGAVRRAVADNTATPQAILARLSRDPEPDVRMNVAHNPATPPGDLVRLGADDRSNNVLRGVAQNAATPPDTRANLARNDDFHVRRGVSLNTASDQETLDGLARDHSAHVRSGVAANAATPAGILDQLADDPSLQVRREVARDPHTPGETLARLALDNENDHFVRAAVARNASTPPEILDQLARDDHPYVPPEVARNAGSRPETLARLAIHDQAGVRNRVARNMATFLEDLV